MAIGGLLAAFLMAGAITAPAPPSCLLMIHDHALLRIAAGAPVPVARLPETVNALGFHEGREIYYGVTPTHLVSISVKGEVTRLAPTPERLRWATAGAIHGDRWFVRGGGDLHVINLQDLSFSLVPVESPSWGDFDWHNGLLYAIATSPAHLVSLNPVSGEVRTLYGLTSLPDNGSFGSLEIAADGVVHAFHNQSGTMYSFPLGAPDQPAVTRIGRAEISDFAGCPRPSPSPSPSRSPSPSPSPSLSRSPSPSPSPSSSPSPSPSPSPVLAVPAPPPSPSPSEPPPPPPVPVLRAAEPVPEPDRPADRPATRTFFVGMLVPAVIVAARGIGRRR